MESRGDPDTVDTRVVLRVFAWTACLAGLAVAGWGPMWFGAHQVAQPWGKAAIVRLLGAILIADACAAAALASVRETEARRRGLLWLAGGHGVVLLMAVIQQVAVWDDVGLPEQTALGLLLAAAWILSYFWQTGDGHQAGEWTAHTRLFGDDTTRHLRSEYERRIREAAQREERNRLARDLHDSIKQQIFATQTAAATVEARLPHDRSGAMEALGVVRASAREAMLEMEAMLDHLREAPLENIGLVEALKKQVEALGFRTGAQVTFELGTLPARGVVPPGTQQAMFRIGQEALANVGRHARAKHVHVRLDSDERHFVLTVKDDGAGFDVAGPVRGLGLENMRSRAGELGGAVRLTSLPGSGTAVRVALPVEPRPDPRYYRRRVLLSGGALLAAGIWVWLMDTTMLTPFWMFAMALVFFMRSVMAYRRVRAVTADGS